jgi:predicted metal-dependent phosphoesterase TrpH
VVGRADLHIHSTASDGRLTPADIVREAAEGGLTYIALADHDTVDGIAIAQAAAQPFPQLKVIPGVEISTDIPQGEVHVLGYFIDYTDHKLGATLDKFRNSRLKRAQGMVSKLDNLGIHIDWQRVQQIAGGSSIGRPHIAQAMLEKGYIDSFKQAFVEYLGRNRPAYVEREKMTPAEAVELIVKAQGLPVLAHPLTVNEPEAMTIELKAAGLVGIEAYYDGYTAEEINRLVELARRYNLIATGGSDYHGLDPTETAIGGADLPIESVERLIALAKQRNPNLKL